MFSDSDVNKPVELAVIIPVYNEQDIIEHVINDLCQNIEQQKIDFEIVTYNDGSKDESLLRLKNLAANNKRLKVIDKENSGHGPTILQGYRNCNSEWIMQIDSDNEIDSNNFVKLWEARDNYDLIIGRRVNRVQPLSRRIVSLISRLAVKIFYGNLIEDVNSPFRIFRYETFKEEFIKIPENTFAPNVILSGIAAIKKLRVLEIDINCTPRMTGVVSINKLKLLKAVIKSFLQTVKFRFKY